MEQIPPWPTSVFDANLSTTSEEETGLSKTNNTEFITTVNKWRVEAESQ